MSPSLTDARKPAAPRPWYEIRAEAGGEATVWIYEPIGEDFFGEGITAKRFVQDLAALQVERIALHLHSPGGSVFDGQAIYTALRAHPATVTTYIDGWAASIASVIALAGDRVVMASNGLFMIHDPLGGVLGGAAEMRKMADRLDKVGETILGVYVDKTAGDPAGLRAAMAEETWYTAEEALAAGLVDEIASPVRLAASAFDAAAFGFQHVPASVAEPSGSHSEDTPAGAAEAPAAAAAEAAPDRARVFVPGVGFRHFSIQKGATDGL